MSEARPTARRWLRVVGSVGLLALTAVIVDVRSVGAALADARVGPALVAVALSIPQMAVTAWRWRFTASRMSLPIPFVVAWREYYVSTLLNQVLPGGVLGDASRVVRLGNNPDTSTAKVARCVVIERASGQVALWLIVAVGAALWGEPGSTMAVLRVVATIVVVGGAVVLASRSARVARTRVGAALSVLLGELRSTMLTRGAWAIQLGASLLAVGLLGLMFYACIVAVGTPVSPTQALLIAPLVLAASALPISVGGWGVREAAAATLFEVAGLSAAHGAAASAIFGAVSLVAAAPGALLLTVLPRLEQPT